MKAILKKLGAFSLGPIVTGLLSFLMTASVTRIITPDEYGRTGMFQTTQSLVLTVILLAVDQAYAREYMSTEPERRDSLLLNALLLPVSASLAASAVFLLLQKPLGLFIFGSETETAAVLLTAAMFPFMVLFRFSAMRFRMEERALLHSGLSILLKSLAFGLSIALLLAYERSFRSVVFGMALAEILAGTLSAVMASRGMTARRFRPDRVVISTLLRYALPLLPATMIGWIFTSSDQYMLRAFSGYEELGLYTAAHKIVAIVSLLQASFTTLWPPVSFRWYESRKPPAYFDAVMWAVGLLSTGLGLGLLLCKDLVALVLGNAFRQSITIFPFLLLNPVMYIMSEATYVGIPFSRKTGYNIIVSAITAVLNVGLNLTLIPIWGGRGAAVATGLSYIAFFWGRTLLSRKLWRPFPIRGFVVNTLVLAANCAAHTFLSGAGPYVVSAASIAALAAANIPQMKKTRGLLRELGA